MPRLDDRMKHRDGAFGLAGEIQRKQVANFVSVALMTPAKLSGETCQGVVGCRFGAPPLDIQHFHWKPPFVTRRNIA